MKKAKVSNFKYQSVFGEMTFAVVTVHIPDNLDLRKIRNAEALDGQDYSISAVELKRMERELALVFFSKSFRAIFNGERTISVEELKGIQNILNVNRSEFAKLLGLHKGSMTNLFKGKAMKSTLCILIMERLGMELGRPGAARHMLDGGKPGARVPAASRIITETRGAHDDEAA